MLYTVESMGKFARLKRDHVFTVGRGKTSDVTEIADILNSETAPLLETIASKDARIKELEAQLALYEQNGAAKLYYSLNRKMNEMADMLNRQSLTTLDLADAKDKSFERIKAVWESAEKVATAIKSLGELAGVTGDEGKDISKKPFVDTIADSRR